MLTKLRVLRVEHNMSQKDLAKVLGVSQDTISSWELGRTSPRPPMMQKVADYFHVSKDEIFYSVFNYSK